MPKKKKPTKIIIKFSNDSTTKKGKGKGKSGGPCKCDSSRANSGPRKLKN